MTFGEQILATLIGTFSGFVGSLILFWIKEYVQSNKKRDATKKNLVYELKYNINLFEKYEIALTKCIEDVAADGKKVYISIDYDYVATFFSQQFYKEGLISEYFHEEDMRRWNDMLTKVSKGSETYLNETLEKWRNSEIEKSEIHKVLTLEREHIKYAKEMSEYIKQKIE